MSGPWEDYQTVESKPWEDFGSQQNLPQKQVPERGFAGSIKEHAVEGIKQYQEGREEITRPKSYTRSLLGIPIINTLSGLLRTAGAPITGPISEYVSRPLGDVARKLPVPDPETLGQQVEGMADVATPFLIDPAIAASPVVKGVKTLKDLLGFGRRIPKIDPRILEAQRGLEAVVAPGIEQAQAERELGKATTGLRRPIQRAVTTEQETAAIARQAETVVPSVGRAQGIAEQISPIQKPVVEAGKYGAEAFKRQKEVAYAPFKREYDALEDAYKGQAFPVPNALKAKSEMSADVEAIERGLRRKPESLAASPIGDMAKLSDEEIADRVSELIRTGGEIQAKSGRFPDWLSPDKLERWANIRVSPELKIKDMILARRRFGAMARGAAKGGNLDVANQFNNLKNAYHADINAVDSTIAQRLANADKNYAENFIPTYGFDSPAYQATKKVGKGEGFLPTIFKTSGKDDLATITAAKRAFDPEDWNVLSRSFTENLKTRSMNDANEFDSLKFTRNLRRYRPETLKEAVGPVVKQNMDLFSNEMATALKLEERADAAIKTSKLAQTEAKAAYKVQKEAGIRYQALEEERLALEGKQQKSAATELKRIEAKLKKEKHRIFTSIKSGFEHAGRWAGPITTIHGLMRASIPEMATGIGLTFAGPAIAKMLSSPKAASLLRGTGRMVAGTPEAVIRSAEINAFLKQLDNQPEKE